MLQTILKYEEAYFIYEMSQFDFHEYANATWFN